MIRDVWNDGFTFKFLDLNLPFILKIYENKKIFKKMVKKKNFLMEQIMRNILCKSILESLYNIWKDNIRRY